MPTLKDSILPIVIIIVASALVVLASMPLAQTEWADDMRGEFVGEGAESDNAGEGEAPPDMGVLIYIAPLIKVTLLMGIGAGLTMFLWRVMTFTSRLIRGPTKASR